MVALLVLLTILIFFTVDYLVERRRADAGAEMKDALAPAVQFTPADFRTPHGVYFDPKHTWLYLEESGTARGGVNEFAQSIVGSIDHIDVRSVGDRVREGEVIVQFHHGDRVATFRAPVDGTVKEINTEFLKRPELRGVEPYTSAWLYRIRPDDTSSVPKKLHLGWDAKQWLNREVQRLKVFLSTIAPDHPILGRTMQDGGLPSGGLSEYLNDDDWSKLNETFFG